MTYYLMVENDEIIGASQSESGEPIVDIEVSEDVYNTWKEDKDRYVWNGSKIVDNPNYNAIKAEQAKQARIAEIKEELEQIDVQAVRPLRAIVSNTATEFDTNKLSILEAQAAELRAELAELG